MQNGDSSGSTNERMNENTPNFRVACWWSLNLLSPIELDWASISKWTEEQPVLNDFLFYQQRLWVVKKLFSVLLRILGFKSKTEDLEGDSDIEKWERRLKPSVTENRERNPNPSLAIEPFNLIPTKNHSLW